MALTESVKDATYLLDPCRVPKPFRYVPVASRKPLAPAINRPSTQKPTSYFSLYNFAALSCSTIRASSSARSLVISPSFIIPVNASANA